MYLHALLLDCTTPEDVAVVVASAHALGQLLPDVIRGRVAMPVDQVQDFTFVQTVFEVCHRSTERQYGPLHLAAHARFVALLAPHVRTMSTRPMTPATRTISAANVVGGMAL